MNRLNFTKYLLIVALMLCPLAFYGQETDSISEKNHDYRTFKDYVYVTGDLGLGFLKGDNLGLKLGLNGHLGIGYQFDNILGIKANLGFGGLDGEYANHEVHKSNYFEGNLNLTINLTDIILGYNPDRKYSIVPHIGIGQVRYRIKLNNDNGQQIHESGYGKRDGRDVIATIPMGVEFNYILNPSWRVHLDLIANYADGDRLDGVASGDHNDWFSTINFGASYRLGSEANLFKRDHLYCNYWYLMADGGASFIFGDNKYNFGNVKGNANIGIGYSFHNFYRIYVKAGYGIYTGQTENVFTLDYADYYEANVNLAADLVGFIFGHNEARRFGLYAHVGLGQMQYRARATYANGKKAAVGYHHDASYNTKGRGLLDRKVALTVPVGLEFNYVLNEKFDAYADVTTFKVDSDVLDVYASGLNKDWRTTVNFGLRYKFANSCARAAAEEAERIDCVTPEELKQAIKDALEEYEASKPEEEKAEAVEAEAQIIEKHTIFHTNHANIVFPVNKSEKLSTQTNIDALNRASAEVQDGFEVERIIVEGYASPEGGAELNDRLAQERAQAAADLVQNELHSHLDDEHITIHSNGADWNGLIEAILGSDIQNKEELADKIKNSSNREQTLRELMNKYPQIEPLLPQLRRANVTITTTKEGN